MPHKAKLIPQDGKVAEILLPDNDADRLAEIARLVGGLYEIKELTNGFVMVMAMQENATAPVNDFATSLAFRAHAIYSDEDIRGAVVVIQGDLV